MVAEAEWKVATFSSLDHGPSSFSSRWRISRAALLVKVTARIRHGATRRASTRWATRRVMTRVFPEPAPARTRSGPSPWRTASRCGGLRSSRSWSGDWSGGGPDIERRTVASRWTSGNAPHVAEGPGGYSRPAMTAARPTPEELDAVARLWNESQILRHLGLRIRFEPAQVVVELPEVRPEHQGGLGTAAVNGLVLAGMFDLALGSTVVLVDTRRRSAT